MIKIIICKKMIITKIMIMVVTITLEFISNIENDNGRNVRYNHTDV